MSIQYDNCYRIERISEIEKYILECKKSLKNFDEQLSTNHGYVYKLNSGEVCFIPNGLQDEDESLIFSSIDCFTYFLNKDSFPISNPHPLIFEFFTNQMENMQNFSQSTIDHFLAKLKLDIEIKDKQTTIQLIFENLDKTQDISVEEKFLYSIVLGEYLRVINNGKWLLLKKYGAFNYYYIPAVEYKSGNFVMISDRVNDFFRYKLMNLQSFLNLVDISSPYHNRNNTYASQYITQ